MTIHERRQRLLYFVKNEPGITISQLAKHLDVSQGTIRNDIDALSFERKVKKVRGGAILAQSTNFTYPERDGHRQFFSRIEINTTAKKCIARQAARVVQDGDSILMDASTTVYHMNEVLLKLRDLRVVTNCLETARILAQNPTHTVMLVGGIVRPDVESVTGPWAEQFLEGLCTRYVFVSCSGFTPEFGMSEVNIFEAHFRLKAIQSANQIIALIDSSKFGEVDLTPSIPSERINHLYTDSRLTPDWQSRLNQLNIPYTICS
jgi:DeoR/GlpR family transcriptional regulator of sugar metabolism